MFYQYQEHIVSASAGRSILLPTIGERQAWNRSFLPPSLATSFATSFATSPANSLAASLSHPNSPSLPHQSNETTLKISVVRAITRRRAGSATCVALGFAPFEASSTVPKQVRILDSAVFGRDIAVFEAPTVTTSVELVAQSCATFLVNWVVGLGSHNSPASLQTRDHLCNNSKREVSCGGASERAADWEEEHGGTRRGAAGAGFDVDTSSEERQQARPERSRTGITSALCAKSSLCRLQGRRALATRFRVESERQRW